MVARLSVEWEYRTTALARYELIWVKHLLTKLEYILTAYETLLWYSNDNTHSLKSKVKDKARKEIITSWDEVIQSNEIVALLFLMIVWHIAK